MTTSSAGLTGSELREGLSSCLAVPRWVDEVMARAPFGSMLDLLDAGAAAANPLTEDEIDQALSHHPRIGERAQGEARSATFSRQEQQTSASDDAEQAEALVAGNRAYEEKFGRVFLIRAAGRTRPQILAELSRRLELDPQAELAVVASELRDIALHRIPQLFPRPEARSGSEESEAAR